MDRQRILIVEDDPQLAQVLVAELRPQYETKSVPTGGEALFLAETEPFDLIVLDLNLPDMDGIHVAEELNQKESEILMLTARADVQSRVAGLYAGASDYLAKPFEMAELMARVHARLRSNGQARKLCIGNVELDPDAGSCLIAGERVSLTAQELRLLTLLMENAGRVFGRETIESRLYQGEGPNSNAVESLVSKVRNKLSQAGAGDLIKTVRGLGYVVR